jgi:hypothetical protein
MSAESVREWTSTLPSELQFWELESQWALESSKGNWKGQNSLDWKLLYINGNFVGCRCLKWACMTHLGTWNTSYGQKKGRESNGQFDSWPLKVRNRPNSLAFRWCATYHWKVLDEDYNFALHIISIKGLQQSYGSPKSWESQFWECRDSNLGVPGQKWHSDVGLVARHKVYYKGEGGGFPQIWAVVSFVNPCLLVARSCTKSVLAMH